MKAAAIEAPATTPVHTTVTCRLLGALLVRHDEVPPPGGRPVCLRATEGGVSTAPVRVFGHRAGRHPAQHQPVRQAEPAPACRSPPPARPPTPLPRTPGGRRRWPYERWAARWSGLAEWFVSGEGQESQARLLRGRALGSIPQLLAVVRQLNERRAGRSDRSADFRTLARSFAQAPDDAAPAVAGGLRAALLAAPHRRRRHPRRADGRPGAGLPPPRGARRDRSGSAPVPAPREGASPRLVEDR
ncbi:DUF2397 family protein [Streptomyces sp. NPDC088766]|uniref:DUF2397 family protein n=1 Tax=Streptomyces sp. NPDC088766 TaxID=3365893 RepID=UPI0037F9C05A